MTSRLFLKTTNMIEPKLYMNGHLVLPNKVGKSKVSVTA